MASTDRVNGFRKTTGGPLETTWGPYPTKVAACEAIPSQLDGDGLNVRSGKTVAIGTFTDYVEYTWQGGFEDQDLKQKYNPDDFLQTEIIGTSPQLFDRTNYLHDTAVTSTGTLAAYPASQTAINSRTALIPILDVNQSHIKLSGIQNLTTVAHRWAFHNDAGTILSFGTVNSEASSSIAIPNGATKFYFTYRTSTGNNDEAGDLLMINYGTVSLPWQVYGSIEVVNEINNKEIKAKALKPEAILPSSGSQGISVMNRDAVLSLLLNYITGSQLTASLPKIQTQNVATYGDQLFNVSTVISDNTSDIISGYLNNTAITSGGVIASSTGQRTLRILVDHSRGSNLKVSGIVDLTTVAHRWAFYNEEGVLVANGNTSGDASSSIAIPPTAKYFYFTFKTSAQPVTAGDALMVNYGSSALPWVAYTPPIIKKTLVSVNEATIPGISLAQLEPYAQKSLAFPYFGKKLLTLGDSITAMRMWQKLLAELTGMIFIEAAVTDALKPLGVGGSRIIPEIKTGTTGQNAGQSIYLRADYVKDYAKDEQGNADDSVIILMGSQNDFSSGSGNANYIGTATFNLNDAPYSGGEIATGGAGIPSFVSAYRGTLEKLITQNPKAKIITMTPMYNGGSFGSQALIDGYKRRNEAIKAISAQYSLQCIDLLSGVGISPLNHTTYLSDGIHPNETGGKAMAKYIAGQLK